MSSILGTEASVVSSKGGKAQWRTRYGRSGEGSSGVVGGVALGGVRALRRDVLGTL